MTHYRLAVLLKPMLFGVGGGLGGAPTLLDVCSFLGMGREGESGEEEEGGWSWVPGVWSPGVCRLSVGLASCSLEGRTGEKLEKEVEREVGTLGVGLMRSG